MWVGKEDRPYIHYQALRQLGLVRAVFATLNAGAQNWIEEVEHFRIIDIDSRDFKEQMIASPTYLRECFSGLPNLKRLTLSLYDHEPIHPSDIDWLQERLILCLNFLGRRTIPEIIWEGTRFCKKHPGSFDINSDQEIQYVVVKRPWRRASCRQ
jgi:hypothetical protein